MLSEILHSDFESCSCCFVHL